MNAPVRGAAGFRFGEGRIQDVELSLLLQGVTHVSHLAAQSGVRRRRHSDFRVYTYNNVDASHPFEPGLESET